VIFRDNFESETAQMSNHLTDANSRLYATRCENLRFALLLLHDKAADPNGPHEYSRPSPGDRERMTPTCAADALGRWLWRNAFRLAPLLFLYGYWRGS